MVPAVRGVVAATYAGRPEEPGAKTSLTRRSATSYCASSLLLWTRAWHWRASRLDPPTQGLMRANDRLAEGRGAAHPHPTCPRAFLDAAFGHRSRPSKACLKRALQSVDGQVLLLYRGAYQTQAFHSSSSSNSSSSRIRICSFCRGSFVGQPPRLSDAAAMRSRRTQRQFSSGAWILTGRFSRRGSSLGIPRWLSSRRSRARGKGLRQWSMRPAKPLCNNASRRGCVYSAGSPCCE
mmetsp:Transcript_35112/g.76681  ORF Transcript_35112/g.76681 Transcript_35112/m.76681 type:complete len:236 (+) Transcript_35112:198-905(+)